MFGERFCCCVIRDETETSILTQAHRECSWGRPRTLKRENAGGGPAVALLAEAAACKAVAPPCSSTLALLFLGPSSGSSAPSPAAHQHHLRRMAFNLLAWILTVRGTGNKWGCAIQDRLFTCWGVWAEDESIAFLCCLNVNPSMLVFLELQRLHVQELVS